MSSKKDYAIVAGAYLFGICTGFVLFIIWVLI